MSNRKSSKKTKVPKKVDAGLAEDVAPTKDTPIRGDVSKGKRKADEDEVVGGPHAKKRAEDNAKAAEEHDMFVKAMAGLTQESGPSTAPERPMFIPEIWKDGSKWGQKEDAFEELQQAGSAHMSMLQTMLAQAELDAVQIDAKLKEAEREKNVNEQ